MDVATGEDGQCTCQWEPWQRALSTCRVPLPYPKACSTAWYAYTL